MEAFGTTASVIVIYCECEIVEVCVKTPLALTKECSDIITYDFI